MPNSRVLRHIVRSFFFVLLTLTACSDAPAVNRVGVNVVDKRIFTGSWYLSRTVLDVDYEAAGVGTFPGDAATDYAGSGFSAIPRIRWVIDEDFLYAYRDYQLIEGEDGAPVEAGTIFGQPVAAFAIESHFDIRRDYNSVTGEDFNVVVENDSDRKWFERRYMRVDWSTNVLPAYYGQTFELYDVIGVMKREPASLFVQDESVFPDSWRPQFHYMSCDGSDDTSKKCKDEDRAWADDYDKGELYHMSFVNQELMSPGDVIDPWSGQPTNWCVSNFSDSPDCTTVSVFTRASFLKVSDSPARRDEKRAHFRQYEAENWVDTRFDRAGYFRLEQDTYDRSTGPDDPAYGRTDFKNYAINRHNIWKTWRDADGNAIPYADRGVRPIVYYTTPELPAHLVRPSIELMANWNEVFMATVRQVRGQTAAEYPRVDCQTEDPDGYCFCTNDPVPDDVLNPTCPGVFDPFETPEDAEARGVKNPYACHVTVPEGAEPNLADPGIGASLRDADFNGWFGAEFVGDECVAVLKMNSCNRGTDAQLAAAREAGDKVSEPVCQERGDMRFKFLSYVDQPGTSFLGIATLRGDPITGELLVGDANIGGPALDSYRTRALQQYDILNGNITEEQLYTGEDVRAYIANLNNVQLPAPPRTDFLTGLQYGSADPMVRREIDSRMGRAMERLASLKGPEGRANTYSDRMQKLKGTPLERRLLENWESLAMAGVSEVPNGMGPADISDTILNRVSPFRVDAHDMLDEFERVEQKHGKASVMMPNEFVDNSVQYYVNKHQDWPRARLEFVLNRKLYFETQLHELGHCLGLRHDFGASADTKNYFDDYYLINDALPMPDPADYDLDNVPGLSPDEQLLYERNYVARKKQRELAGVDQWMNSSVMEYTANWYQRVVSRAGRYDFSAISFGYGDVVEVYDNEDGLAPDAVNPTNTSRAPIKYYQGGEVCEADSDCPYAEDGARAGELLGANMSSGVTQRCVAHPNGGTNGNVCSNFDEDMAAAAGSSNRWLPVSYRFCTDERAAGGGSNPGTIGWCNRFDEGDSYREIVRNVAETYERSYLWNNFRRYRRTFDIGSYIWSNLIGRQLIVLQNVYQNLIFQYASDPEFQNQTGEFGFYDEFLATADVLNFYARVLTSPDIGGYQWSDQWNRYERVTSNPNSSAAQLSVPIGLGRYSYSVYQRGLSGIQRIERIGAFYDKLMTVQLLASRGGGFSQPRYTRDLPFFANYYDVFPLEMQQIFNGMIREKPEEYMPRVRCGQGSSFPDCFDPTVVYLDFYRGDCSAGSTTCRAEPKERYKNERVLNGGASFLLQLYATIYGLAQFPTFFDTTFQNQLFICVQGQGDCNAPSESAVEGVDYVRFTSERYGKSFLAWQVSPSTQVANQTSIGFAMVKEADDLSFTLRMIRKLRDPNTGDPVPSNLTQPEVDRLTDPDGINYTIPTGSSELSDDEDRVFGRVYDLESFFNQLIQLERDFGIYSYLGFNQ
ncbi:MAG: hypothetical protein KC417_04995 [Myxococcales bacterium]|nr:hypothetical protein [Myxococcales bacterium]